MAKSQTWLFRAFALSVTAISVAAFVNHRTLTRSTSGSRAYRRPQQPFGLTAKRGLAG